MLAAPARSWSSRTIRRCANSSRSSSRTRAIARPRRVTASQRWIWWHEGRFRPDLILADYNLPNGMNGLQLAAQLREKLHRPIPVIILTGDISTGTLRDIALQDCVQLNKPVKLHGADTSDPAPPANTAICRACAVLRTPPKQRGEPRAAHHLRRR